LTEHVFSKKNKDGEGLSFGEQAVELLKYVVPNAFIDDRIDFETLSQFLNIKVAKNKEIYGLTWDGKKKAHQTALTPSTGMLRPCPKESVDWTTTKNVFIDGDNLNVLKLLQKSYGDKIKMIYIDPPYNTGSDFVYSDRYRDSLYSYAEPSRKAIDGNVKTSSSIVASGRKHANWLSMMLPRLQLARTLLTDEGLLVCHIDEHEFSNIHCLLDEVFGAENNLGPIVWDKRNPKGDVTGIAMQHEYIVIYAKNAEKIKGSKNLKKSKNNAGRMLKKASRLFSKLGTRALPDDLLEVITKYEMPINVSCYEREYGLREVNSEYRNWLSKQAVSGGEAAYDKIDEYGQVYQPVSMAWPNKKVAPDDYHIPLVHPFTGKKCPVPKKGWRNPPETMRKLKNKNLILFGADESTQPRRKYLLSENINENIPSILSFGGSDNALLSSLGIPFDNPKPTGFVKTLLKYFLSDGDMFVDFFAGSATSAHAAMQLCAEEGHSIRFILVQFSEVLDPNKTQQKTAAEFCKANGKPLNIAEISKERIRRAANKIKKDYPEYVGDLGFKVFKFDSSNTCTTNFHKNVHAKTLIDCPEYLIEDMNNLEVIYKLLLERGFSLTDSIEGRFIAEATVYCIGCGNLFVCFNYSIAKSGVEALGNGIVDWRRELGGKVNSQIIFRSGAFNDDVDKAIMFSVLGDIEIINISSL
jgi:adenine-specific DNA-methyltransferase